MAIRQPRPLSVRRTSIENSLIARSWRSLCTSRIESFRVKRLMSAFSCRDIGL